MKERGRRRFTLIELLVVMLLMGLIMSLMLPAFNRMIRGNRVDQLASGLKLGLEQAQSQAVRSRKYVALVLPNDRSAWEDESLSLVQPFSHGGFRLAYVKSGTSGWEFVRWVDGQEWKNAPDGAMLVRVMAKDDSDYNDYKMGDGVKDVAKSTESDDEFDALADLKNLRYGNLDSNDGTTPNSADVKCCLVVFSPYGGLVGDQDLRLVIAEAVPNGDTIVYPTKDADGNPVNWKMLSINKFTGRVEYYPLPE
ncbi:hypothetical protein [uncultured Victivallis sp.]|uniref:pilus assembly FimT family protein n=1 Tax=uncultured Victivallis sp. TaxID=354118 RepID=UPI0025FFE14B|nr:hypothetical protein [uncultured Victivallis sp.]